MRVTYTAKRALASGHSASTSYDLDLLASVPVATLNPINRQAVAIDGTPETLLLRIERTWSFSTDHFTRSGSPSTYDLVQEWLASVMGGETFTFDPYRVPGGSAVSPVSVILVPGSAVLQPINEGTQIYTLSAQVRERNAIV